MPTTTSYSRGAVVLLPFPFSDLSLFAPFAPVDPPAFSVFRVVRG